MSDKNSGKDYEDFVYQTLKEFYPDLTVTKDEKVFGKQSGRFRQIDVIVRAVIEGAELFYLVQAKDYSTRKADINKIGEFSSVIKDVGGSGGFLICAKGFSKENHKYAKNLGIELLSIEDINSDRWKIAIQIPIIIIKYEGSSIKQNCKIEATQQLIYKDSLGLVNKSELPQLFSNDNGKTFFNIFDYVNKYVVEKKQDLSQEFEIDFDISRLYTKISEVIVPVMKLNVRVIPNKKHYLKFVAPDEYRQIKNHISGLAMPTKLELSFSYNGDETEVNPNDLPVHTEGLHIELEFEPPKLENPQIQSAEWNEKK